MAFELSSPAFEAGDRIPRRFTCEGEDVSPPLAWTDPPEGTASFALIVDDPDAPDPDAPRTTWSHWVLYDIPADARALPEDAGGRERPLGARDGINDWRRRGYGGPCPPIGRHRYFFRLYALDTTLGELERPTRGEILRRIEPHVLAVAELMGTYRKGDP